MTLPDFSGGLLEQRALPVAALGPTVTYLVYLVCKGLRGNRAFVPSPLCRKLLLALGAPVGACKIDNHGTLYYLTVGPDKELIEAFWDDDHFFNHVLTPYVKVQDVDVWPYLTRKERKAVLAAVRQKWYDVSSHQKGQMVLRAQKALDEHLARPTSFAVVSNLCPVFED